MADEKIIYQKTEKAPEGETPKQTADRVRLQVEAYWRSTQVLRLKTKESHNFVVGGQRQWGQDEINDLTEQKRPVMSFNVCQDKVNFLAGYQSEREQDYRYFPRGSEDEQLGRLATALVKYSMDVGDGVHAQHKQFRQGIIGGLSVLELSHSYDYNDDLVEGECSLTVLPENGWYCDPAARRYDRCDASFQGKLPWMSLEYARRKWPKSQFLNQSFQAIWDSSSADPGTTGVPDHFLSNAFFLDKDTQQIRLIQHWYRVPVTIAVVANLQTGEVERFKTGKQAEEFVKEKRDTAGRQASEIYQIQESPQIIQLVNMATRQAVPLKTTDEGEQFIDTVRQQAGAEAASRYKVLVRDATAMRVSHLTAWEMLDDNPAADPNEWRYPFSPFICYQDLDDYNAIKGIIEDIKDPQRELNWHYSTLLDVMLRGPKGGVWLDPSMESKIQTIKSQYSRPGFVGVWSGQPPVPVTPQIIPQGDIEMIQFSISEAMRITGLTAELLGQSTQRTISGRARQVTQAGALVGVASVLMNWMQTKKFQGQALLKQVQKYYSVEKMNRIIGQNQRIAEAQGMLGQQIMPDAQMFELFKKLKNTDLDVAVGFQEANPTARAAVATQLMQLVAVGFPIPPEIILEASDVPFKEDIKAALQKQGMQQPNEAIAKVIGAGQGSQPQPDGVNK